MTCGQLPKTATFNDPSFVFACSFPFAENTFPTPHCSYSTMSHLLRFGSKFIFPVELYPSVSNYQFLPLFNPHEILYLHFLQLSHLLLRTTNNCHFQSLRAEIMQYMNKTFCPLCQRYCSFKIYHIIQRCAAQLTSMSLIFLISITQIINEE